MTTLGLAALYILGSWGIEVEYCHCRCLPTPTNSSAEACKKATDGIDGWFLAGQTITTIGYGGGFTIEDECLKKRLVYFMPIAAAFWGVAINALSAGISKST